MLRSSCVCRVSLSVMPAEDVRSEAASAKLSFLLTSRTGPVTCSATAASEPARPQCVATTHNYRVDRAMFSPVEATMGRYSRYSDQTAGASHPESGRPTAEAVEFLPRINPQQRKLQSFNSTAAEIGSVGVRDLPSADLAQYKDPSPAYFVNSSNNWSATGISEDPVSVKDVAASKPVNNATDVELCRKVQAASGAAAAQDSRLATTAAKAVTPHESLTSDKTGRRNIFNSLQGRTCSAKTAAHLGPVAHSTAVQSSAPHPRNLAPHPPLSAKATTTAAAAAGSAPPAATPLGTLWPYIQQHGRGIMSISTLQEGLQYFEMPGVGYIAYSWMNNGPDFLNILTPVALGDPVCAVSNYSLMAATFLKKHPKAMFLQISKEFGLILRGLGMLVNSVGGETRLDLTKYTFSGYAKRGLRSAISSAVKEGITVQEVMKAPMDTQELNGPAVAGEVQKDAALGGVTSAVEWSQVSAEMIEIDGTWVKNKGSHAGRVWFVNRPPVFAPEPGVRKFTARDRNGALLAFIFFDAVYEQGHITGYYANVTRMKPDAHPGALNLIISKFIDMIRSESQLLAPAKNLSVKKSQRKQKRQQQPQPQTAPLAAAAAAAGSPPATGSSSSTITSPNFLSLGLSPLHQIQDGDPFSYSRFVHRLFEFSFKQGSGYYPFRSLAAAKAKYGAGLHDGVYEDPSVTYQQVYLAHTHRRTACATMFDLGKMIGFWNSPWDAAVSFSGHKLSDGRRLVTNKIKKITKNSKGSDSSGSSSSSKRAGSGKGSAAARSGTQSKVSDPAPDRRTTGSVVSSCDSGDSNWRSRCLLLGFSSRKLYDVDSTKDARSDTMCSTSNKGSKPCIFRKGRALLPLVRPVKPQVPAGTAAAADSGSSSVADKRVRGALAPAGCSTDPEASLEMTVVASDTGSSSDSGYIGTADCPTSATSSSSQGSSTPVTQD